MRERHLVFVLHSPLTTDRSIRLFSHKLASFLLCVMIFIHLDCFFFYLDIRLRDVCPVLEYNSACGAQSTTTKLDTDCLFPETMTWLPKVIHRPCWCFHLGTASFSASPHQRKCASTHGQEAS